MTVVMFGNKFEGTATEIVTEMASRNPLGAMDKESWKETVRNRVTWLKPQNESDEAFVEFLIQMGIAKYIDASQPL